jgi:hypothetical protein
MLSPNARAQKERIFSMTVKPKIGKKGVLDKYFNSGPPITTITPSTTLIILVATTQHAL